MNAPDPFCGRGYCSYVDRKENLTHYFRNHALVDAFLDQFVTDGAQILRTSGKRSTDLGGSNPQSPKKPASIEQRLPAEIILTSIEPGGGDDLSSKTKPKPPVWQEGELRGNLEEFIAAAFWMESKTEGVRKPTAFKSSVRKRITAEGPNAEDWETLTAWRAAQAKPAATENPEEAKLAAEKKLRLAIVKQLYTEKETTEQEGIESRFAAHVQISNVQVYRAYCLYRLDSKMVIGAFNEWLLGELQ